MIGRRPALRSFLLFAAVCVASCRPTPEQAPPRREPSGPPPPVPGQTAAALGATGSRGAAPAPGNPLPLAVVGFGPRGNTQGGATIYVRFNQAMVSLEKTNQELTTVGIELDPKLAGRSFYQTPEMLVFEPKESLPLASRITAQLVGPVQALSGARLTGPLKWELETPRPSVTGWEVHEMEDTEALRNAEVVLTLDQPTTLAALQRLLTAKAFPADPKAQPRRGQPVAIRVTEPDAAASTRLNIYFDKSGEAGRIFVVSPVGLWPGQRQIELTVQKGLPTSLGPLTSERPFSTAFQTLSPLRLVDADCAPTKPCGLTPIALRFNNRIVEEQLKKLRITPVPKEFEIELLPRWSDGAREVTLKGEFVPGTTYKIALPADFSDRFGQRLGKAITLDAVIARRPTLELSKESGTLRYGETQTVGVMTRHVRTLKVRGAVLDDQTAVALLTERPPPAKDDQPPPLAPWPVKPLRQFEQTYTLAPQGPSDWHELTLDIAALSGAAHRAVLIEVQPGELVPAAVGQPLPPPVRGLYRLTELGPLGMSSRPQQLLAVMRLTSGQPVMGAQLSLHRVGQQPVKLGQTDTNGLLVVPGAPAPAPADPSYLPAVLVAESPDGTDHAYMLWPTRDETPRKTTDPAAELRHGERLITHVVTERDAYLPGELVRVVGWSAIDTPYQRSGLRRPAAGSPVTLRLEDARRRVVATHQTTLTAEGKFWAELPIPAQGALGSYKVHTQLLGRTEAQNDVRVEDFRVPEFNVSATVSRADVLPGETTRVLSVANYFFGGPVRIRSAAYRQSCVVTRYTPPGVSYGWVVGSPEPDRHYYSGDGARTGLPPGGLGRLSFDVQPLSEGEPFDRRCTVDLALTDSSFQSIGAQTDYLAHAARYYLAMEQQKDTITEGDTARVAVRALAVDGARLAAPGVSVGVEWVHDEPLYNLVNGQKLLDGHKEVRDFVTTCRFDLAATGQDLGCQFAVVHPGRYVLVARGPNKPDTRYARVETSLWVQPRPTKPEAPVVAPRAQPHRLSMELSSQKVKPGDTLKVTLSAQWLGASGVLTLSRNGLREHHPFQLRTDTVEINLPVDDTWFPEVTLEAFLVRMGRRQLPIIERASDSVTLLQEHRQLEVTVTAAKESSPGAELPVAVQIQDADHKPCAARVALWAVDEAVLSLTNYGVGSPLATFVPTRQANTEFREDYSSFIAPFKSLGSDPWFNQGLTHSAFGSLRGRTAHVPSLQQSSAMVTHTRSRFETTPLFLGDVATGPDGIARATVHLPDNMTTFRLTAVASARLVDGQSPGRFGAGDARVRVTAPLVLRAALPRLMRPGDTAELGALVNNLSGPRGRMRLTVRVHESGPASLQLNSPAQIERIVERGDQLRLPFSVVAVRATKTPAVVEVEATLTPDASAAPVLHDALQLPLPVEAEPTLRERVATYGDLTSDAAIRIPVQVPEAVRKDVGGLTVSASTSLLGGVADAAAELIEYPYGCVEQTASRVLPLVALRDVMKTYPLPIPAGDVAGFMAAGVERILSMQTSQGGFAYWPGSNTPNVYASAYATWVLQLARRAGYAIPTAELDRAADYLQSIVEPKTQAAADGAASDDSTSYLVGGGLLGYDYLDSGRRALAVQVLAELGRPVPRALGDLVRRRDELPLFARALLVLALKAQKEPATDPRLSAEALSTELLNNIAELPATAHVNDAQIYDLETLFYSSTRTDAMVLLALLRTQPHHPVVSKLARGLLERRGGAGWRNTQETAYAVLALGEYAQLYEHELPELTTRAWVPSVSQRPQWEASFSGRSFMTKTLELPMAKLLPGLLSTAGQSPGAASGLLLQRLGQGRLYYRVGFEWSPDAADLPARAQGLWVERRLRAAGGEVTAATLLPPAAPVAIDVVLENRARLNYVVVNVPLPAGLEAVQMNLGRGQKASTLPGERSDLLSHEEARRDRVLLFFDELQPGRHRHTIYVRTTTPGHYTLPPASAETMYTPEIYGRSASGGISVTDQLLP